MGQGNDPLDGTNHTIGPGIGNRQVRLGNVEESGEEFALGESAMLAMVAGGFDSLLLGEIKYQPGIINSVFALATHPELSPASPSGGDPAYFLGRVAPAFLAAEVIALQTVGTFWMYGSQIPALAIAELPGGVDGGVGTALGNEDGDGLFAGFSVLITDDSNAAKSPMRLVAISQDPVTSTGSLINVYFSGWSGLG